MKPSLLFASFLSGLAVLAAVLVTGCASSERMNRLAWDSDSYSAPKAKRISGGKYDDAVVKLRTPVGLQDRQVNIWPFCTVNSRYVSILWPFIDWDEFGMAIRPFYNREGNDASILFPLSSWNTVDGDGWALNAYWDPDYFGIFPLCHIGKQPKSFWFAGPFVGNGNSFGVIPLCYFGEDLSFTGPVWWQNNPREDESRSFGLFPIFWKLDDSHAVLPLYIYVPKEMFLSPLLCMEADAEGEKWKKGIYMLLGYWSNDWKRHGFRPFYNVDTTDDGEINHVLLWFWEHNKPVCGLLPFAWFDSTEDDAFNYALLWWWEHNRPKCGLFPFAKFDRTEDDALNYVLLQYWQNDWKRHGFFPFYSADSTEDDAFNYALLWWWRHNSKSCGLFPFAWFDKDGGFVLPFGGWKNKSATHMDGSEETWSEGNILLLGYWGRTAWGAFPFFRGSSAEEDMKYIGPAWWAYDADEREYGFFPFFRVERSRGETKKSYLFPAYFWEKDEYGSEFSSIPFARKDYEYPAYRQLASERERRYLIYDSYRKTTRRFNGENSRDDFIRYFGYSESFRADRDRLMQEDDLTKEEAVRELDDQVVATTEERTDSLQPFFEWTRDNDGGRELGLLLKLLNFKRTNTSYSDTLLWGLLLNVAGEEEKDLFNLPKSSERFHFLTFFPGYSSKTEYQSHATLGNGFYSFATSLVEEYLLRAGLPDDSEESEIWSKDLLRQLSDRRYVQTFSPAPASNGSRRNPAPEIRKIATDGFDISNDEIFRICGVDRALDGKMTAKEAEETAKQIMDAVITHVRNQGEHTDMNYGFLPLFLRSRESIKTADGEERLLDGKVLTPLTFSKSDEDSFEIRVLLGLLGHYTDKTTDKHLNGAAATENSASVLTLIRSGRESRPVFQSYYAEVCLERFASVLKDENQSGENPIAAGYSRKLVDAACKELLTLDAFTPGFRDAVIRYRDGERSATDRLALLNAIADQESAIFTGNHVETNSGFYPLFFWNKDYKDLHGEVSDVSKSWFILPLLTGGSSDSTGSSLGILCPLIYFGATQIHDTDVPHPGRIIPASANALQASHSIDPVKGETDRYALFLVGTGEETFVQWKPDTDTLVSQLYGTLYQMKDEYDVANLTPAELADLATQKVSSVLSQTEQRRINTKKSWAAEWNNILMQADATMERLGMTPLDRETKLRESIPSVLEAIAKEHIQTRTITSVSSGWGLTSAAFECKETGDYQTKALFGLLANNHKIGPKEHRSILGYLYNMDTDGVNTRKFIFPFITTKDAPGFHEWSFLGGLFERSEENGKTGGRIFFFPYGHRPGSADDEED